MAKPSTGRSFLGTLALVFLAILVLFGVDMFLAGMERLETGAEAGRLFRQGRNLMQSGDNTEAIERIKDAIAIERGNRDYRRTLAQAQLAAGDTGDAEFTLTDLLQSDSTDGLASLIMARVLEKEGRFEEAITYYRRAIYGHWDQDQPGNQLRARFELIDLLARQSTKEELLAELLPLQDLAPGDLKTQERLGQLFLQAGSPARAADVFHGILHDAPADAAAHAGLGQAEFARGNYHAADRDFQAALRLAPNDEATRQRLELCTELLTLDPTVRGLNPGERFHRSVKLVELTMNETSRCVGPKPPPDLQALLDKAAKTLKARVTAARQSDVAESNLDLVEQLWQARRKDCTSPPAPDSPVALVVARLAQ
jgi:tetratricopeptide (TPR) repeat protein